MKIKGLLPSFLLFVICACKTPAPTISGPEVEPASKINPDSIYELPEYRKSYTREFELIHTQLELFPEWSTKTIRGKAELILRPWFYEKNELTLQAKYMDIEEVSLSDVKKDKVLTYTYDKEELKIILDRNYSRSDTLRIKIKYTANPENIPSNGSLAIRSNKGFYFINADLKDPYKPREFWTQCETESASAWFPTIEDPQQRMSQEISIRVDSSLVTISNGSKTGSVMHPDGTRTDTWIQEQRLPPYLTMVAAGKFSVIRDTWKGKEVSYYVDPAYAPYARITFGKTIPMLDFFSEYLAFPYPWDKYSQVVVHDYISGAMENNTAVIHGTNMNQDPRAHIDDDDENFISHELFHHWFGNLVTSESWSNITLNESFANYSEYLWREYAYGRDDADRLNQTEQGTYLYLSKHNDPPLVRYQYEDKEDMYDVISYNKGGRILHMLRKYLGDEAFKESLRLYLRQNAYGSAEVSDLRKACEFVSGEDLHWFFDQWYYKGGRPSISVDYRWNDTLKKQFIFIKQTQDKEKNPVYRLVMDVDFYLKDTVQRKRIVMDKSQQEFEFEFPEKPLLVNVDAEKMLLCERKQENKNDEEYIYQYHHAPLFPDRYEALIALGKNYRINTTRSEVIRSALNDSYWKLRVVAIEQLGEWCKNAADSVSEKLNELALKDPAAKVREAALKALSKYYPYKSYSHLFEQMTADSSYRVCAAAFQVIADKDLNLAEKISTQLEADSGKAILLSLAKFYGKNANSNKNSFFEKALSQSSSITRYSVVQDYGKYIVRQEEPVIAEGITMIQRHAGYRSPGRGQDLYIKVLNTIQEEVQFRIRNIEKQLKDPEITEDKKVLLRQRSEAAELINLQLIEALDSTGKQ